MERLIEDANKFREANGEAANLSIQNYSDVIEAIHEVQVQIGITGTTAEEAAKTLEGSAGAAEAAWQNLLTGLADPTADLDKLIDDFISAKTTQIENLLPTVEHTIEGIGKAIDHLIPELDGAGEELAKLLTEDAIPAVIEALKWLLDHKELIAAALKGMVTAAAIKGFLDIGGAVGGVLTSLNGLAGAAPTVATGLSNMATSMLGLTTATTGATTAATAFGTSLGVWGVILTATTALALGLAEVIHEADKQMQEANEHANGFSDTANDVLARYAEITTGKNTQSAEELKKQLDADQQALDEALNERVQYKEELEKIKEELANFIVTDEDDFRRKQDMEDRQAELENLIQNKDREIEVYENVMLVEGKLYEERSQKIDEELTQVEERTATHIQRINDLYQEEEKFVLGSQEHLESFESQWDKISHWDKESFDRYWEEKNAWLDQHKTNEEWWWNEKRKVDKHYQDLEDAEQKQREKEQREQEQQRQKEQREQEQARRKQEQEDAKKEREHLAALKSEKEKAYRDINISAYSQTFEDDLAQTKYILDEQLKWLTENQSKLTQELYDQYYEDWLKAYDTYNSKVKSAQDKEQTKLEQEQKQNQQKFESASGRVYKDILSNTTNQIKDIKTSFDQLIAKYQSGYNAIINQRDAYKQKLMGGSVFEVLQKTDEKTGEQYTQYTINNLKKRLKEQREYAQQIAALENRGLADGLIKELDSMDAETASIFAKQLNTMSDAEFNELNNAYKQLDKDTTKLANERYKDELDKLEQDFVQKATDLFDGMDVNLKNIGYDGIMAYINGFKSGFEENSDKVVEELKGSVDHFLDGMSEAINDGTQDITKILEENLVEMGLGDKMVDAIINEINENKTDLQEAIRDLLSLDGYVDLLYADLSAKSAVQSSGGYNLATQQTANQQQQQTLPTQQKQAPQTVVVDSKQAQKQAQQTLKTETVDEKKTTKASSQKITIEANLKLTDKAGQVIADVVNAYNKRIEIGVGS